MRRPLINDLLLPKPPRPPLFLVRPHHALPRPASTHPTHCNLHEVSQPHDPPSARDEQDSLQQLQQHLQEAKPMQVEASVKIQRYLSGQQQTECVRSEVQQEQLMRKNSSKTHLRNPQPNEQLRRADPLQLSTMELRKVRAAKLRNLRDNKQNNDKERQALHEKVKQLQAELTQSQAETANVKSQVAELEQQICREQQQKQELVRQMQMKEALWASKERELRLQLQTGVDALEEGEKKLLVALGQLGERESQVVQLWGLLQ